MANLNKVMLIGRLTRDPEVRTFGTGGKVAAFGFAVNNRRKNTATGQWEEDPVFLDLEAFNRGESGRALADQVEQYFHKGHQYFIEGHLKLDQWTDKEGQKRSRLKIVVDNFQFLEPRAEGAGGEGGSRFSRGPGSAPARKPVTASPADSGFEEPHAPEPEPEPMESPGARGEEDIPF
jgi:single-strand DNA-binding protein